MIDVEFFLVIVVVIIGGPTESIVVTIFSSGKQLFITSLLFSNSSILERFKLMIHYKFQYFKVKPVNNCVCWRKILLLNNIVSEKKLKQIEVAPMNSLIIKYSTGLSVITIIFRARKMEN
ncbi:unnamed protein product [Rotaria socialis]